jgi:AcrR family transcriptional regulator
MSRPRQVSDEQILSAARACFLESGPGAPTSLIAERLGVSQAALFKRFGSKSRLLLAALRPPQVPPWVALLEEGPDNRPLPEQLLEISLEISRFFRDMVPCMAVLRATDACLQDLLGDSDVPPPMRGSRALESWVRRAQRQERLEGDLSPAVFAHALLGGLHHGAFLAYLAGVGAPEIDEEAAARGLVDLLLRGLLLEETLP